MEIITWIYLIVSIRLEYFKPYNCMQDILCKMLNVDCWLLMPNSIYIYIYIYRCVCARACVCVCVCVYLP